MHVLVLAASLTMAAFLLPGPITALLPVLAASLAAALLLLPPLGLRGPIIARLAFAAALLLVAAAGLPFTAALLLIAPPSSAAAPAPTAAFAISLLALPVLVTVACLSGRRLLTGRGCRRLRGRSRSGRLWHRRRRLRLLCGRRLVGIVVVGLVVIVVRLLILLLRLFIGGLRDVLVRRHGSRGKLFLPVWSLHFARFLFGRHGGRRLNWSHGGDGVRRLLVNAIANRRSLNAFL
jgi:hypothetical protein